MRITEISKNIRLPSRDHSAIFCFLFSRFSKIILCSIFYLLISLPVYAAKIYFVPAQESVFKGDIFEVEVRLDSAEPINAVQAEVSFSKNLEIVSIDKAKSVLRLWPQEPSYYNEFGIASLAGGLVSPGFFGSGGLISTIKFRAKNTGESNLSFLDTSKILLNDGLGTSTILELGKATMSVLLSPLDYVPSIPKPASDFNPPQAFTPKITRAENVYNGQYFVVFEAEDKDSGIAYYEVQELKDGNNWSEWKRASSPYVLANQQGKIRVFVRAVDQAGNETIGTVEVIIENEKIGIYITFFIVTIIIILIIVLVLRQHVYKKK